MNQADKGILHLAADFKAAGERYQREARANDLIDTLRLICSVRDMRVRTGETQHEFRTKQDEYMDSID